MMRKALLLFLLLACVLVISPAQEAGDRPLVRVLQFSGMIQPASAQAFSRAIREAEQDGASLLLVELDTPGGLVDSAKKIFGEILESDVPVCIFVTPRGAQAASGGFFLLLAADVAAMSPVTTTGAAHPVNLLGENKEGDIMLKKVAEDLTALVRSAARARNRPVDLAQQAITEAKAWNSEEALEAGLIDTIAQDREVLLTWLNGREITRADGSVATIDLTDPVIEVHELSSLEEFKAFLLHPVIMAALLLAGIGGLYVEFHHPGLILPGVVGVICLLVFAWVIQVMPVNFFGIALIAVGIVLFVLEIKVISYGLLSIVGTVCLGIGIWILFPRDIPGLELTMLAFVPLLLSILSVVAFVTYFVAKAHRQPVTTGREGMVGKTGEVALGIEGEGKVFVHGEYWNASARDPIEKGARIRVLAVDGFVLSVERERSEQGKGSQSELERGES